MTYSRKTREDLNVLNENMIDCRLRIRRVTVCILITLFALPAFAQQSMSFNAFKRYTSKVYDIHYTEPKGFTDMKTVAYWRLDAGRKGTVSLHSFVFQSNDGNCLLMYPHFIESLFTFPPPSIEHKITTEIKALLGLIDSDGFLLAGDIDFDKYVEIASAEEARLCFNADSVYVAHLPLREAYEERYDHCIGVYVGKKDRPRLYFKLLLTKEGMMHEKRYFRELCNSVSYRNDNWVYNEEIDKKARIDILYKDRYKK